MSPGPNLEKLLLDPLLAARLRRRLRAGSLDIVHAHHFEGVLVARIAARGRPCRSSTTAIRCSHRNFRPITPGPFRPALQAIGRQLDRRLPALADHVCTVTTNIADRLIATHGFDPLFPQTLPEVVELQAQAGPGRGRPRGRGHLGFDDVERLPTFGGSLRVFASPRPAVTERGRRMLDEGAAKDAASFSFHADFARQAKRSRVG
jgi:hypothetical protein